MAEPSGLTPELEDMSLASSALDRSSHTLALEYPHSDLLPEGRYMPTLISPHNCGFRERPDSTKYALIDNSTDFVLRLPLGASRPAGPSAGTGLFAAVSRLQDKAEKSVLAATTYVDSTMDFFYRFRLTTVPFDRSESEVCIDAELTPENWAEAQRMFAPEPWMHLLTDLLVRASDRAYFHVEARLGAYRAYRAGEAQRAGEWGFEVLRGPNELLAMNLGHPVVQSGGSMGRKVIEDLSREGNGNERLVLGCGHEQIVFMPLVKQMSVTVCKIFACKTCGEKALQDIDMWLLGIWEERARRKEFWDALEQWKRLDQLEFPPEHSIRVTAAAMRLALEMSLEGLWVPETVVPALLCEAKGTAANAMLEGLNRSLDRLDIDTANHTETEEKLMELAERVANTRTDISGDNAGWWQIWFSRAVKLLFLTEDERAGFDAAVGQRQSVSGELDILLADTQL